MDDRFKLPEPRMRDEFRLRLRSRLLSEAAVALAPRPRGTAWVSWLRPALAVATALVFLVGGAGVAAAGSLPGDPAFALKRAAEEVQLALTFDDIARLRLLADLADHRLGELERTADRPDRAPTASDEFAAAVQRFKAAVATLKDAAPADKSDAADDVAQRAREKHEAVLDQLKDRVPAEAKDGIERAIEEERGGDHEGKPDRTAKPSERAETPRPSESGRPRETERATPAPTPSRAPASPTPSRSPRATERTETPRPSETTEAH